MLLTRLPLRIATALDLHVLSLPPAFVLSQDQTLKFETALLMNKFTRKMIALRTKLTRDHVL